MLLASRVELGPGRSAFDAGIESGRKGSRKEPVVGQFGEAELSESSERRLHGSAAGLGRTDGSKGERTRPAFSSQLEEGFRLIHLSPGRRAGLWIKILIEDHTDRILGAHLVGPGVDEVINLFALAIRNHLTSQEVADTVFAYPTGASDVSYML